jgi:lipopolysaccharide export system permease protein
VIPYATLKFKTLYYDILYKKPALDLKEGTFYTHIPNYAIKVGKKDKDGSHLKNVIIYEQQAQLQDNSIVAERGIMEISADKLFLEFTLNNGCRYQERGNSMDSSTEFIRVAFKEYKKVFDIRSLQMMNTSDSFFRNDYKMLTIRQLNIAIDSLKKVKDSFGLKFNKEVGMQLRHMNTPDSIWNKYAVKNLVKPKVKKFNALLPDSARSFVVNSAIGSVSSLKSIYQFSGAEWEAKKKDIRLNNMEWHRKFSLSLACLVLFFIGAPLGSIIRKGGLGMPLVVAIIFFLIFHLLYMFGEKFVKEGVTSPFIGMWLPVLVLSPIGIFFTYKAMQDSQLFNKEYYHRLFKKIKLAIKALRKLIPGRK